MRVYAYEDRFGDARFGVLVDGGLLTGAQLEKRGGLREVDTHISLGIHLQLTDDWQRHLRAGDAPGAQGRRAADRPRGPAPHRGPRRAGHRRQDRLRRAQLPRPRGRGRPSRRRTARCCSRSSPTRSSATATRSSGRQGTHALDLEVELGVVIGRRARRVDARPTPWTTSPATSSSTTSAPATGRATRRRSARARRATASGCGPRAPTRSCRSARSFVTPDELDPAARPRDPLVADPGQRPGRRQPGPDAGRDDGRHDLRRPRPDRVHQSQQITLEPGDLVVTGTPAGVGVFRDPPVFLEPGDRVRCEIDGIGAVENPIVDWTDDPRRDA